MARPSFVIEAGDLVVGAIRLRPGGYAAKAALAVPADRPWRPWRRPHVVVLLDPDESPRSASFQNVRGYRWTGAELVEVWRAELPWQSGVTDFFFALETYDDKLVVFSWSSYRMTLDWDSGKTLESTFTK
jgi:hypothetical protein